MTWQEYLAKVDDSHQMTTSREHLAELCAVAEGCESILELGSHAGISTAALALAAPRAEVVSIDLCDTVPEADRVRYWSSLGITNIKPTKSAAMDYLSPAARLLPDFDLIFHDAAHGDAVVGEYLLCLTLAKTLAIHDWEQISHGNQKSIASACQSWSETYDRRGRALFIGRVSR